MPSPLRYQIGYSLLQFWLQMFHIHASRNGHVVSIANNKKNILAMTLAVQCRRLLAKVAARRAAKKPTAFSR